MSRRQPRTNCFCLTDLEERFGPNPRSRRCRHVPKGSRGWRHRLLSRAHPPPASRECNPVHRAGIWHLSQSPTSPRACGCRPAIRPGPTNCSAMAFVRGIRTGVVTTLAQTCSLGNRRALPATRALTWDFGGGGGAADSGAPPRPQIGHFCWSGARITQPPRRCTLQCRRPAAGVPRNAPVSQDWLRPSGWSPD
jgi:hypothetical protein